ncbi:ABC transporter ATP-binding protein [Marivita sp.]|uniref:ABC transporter ATP-binding protein n=1 Tax=Marivita sp. TaxID=2003365 RepID=UPI003F6D6CCE
MEPMVRISNVRKAYAGGFEALKSVSLDIQDGEILALLGPNGAGKTTLISTICGITQPTSGTITVGGHDVITAYRGARSLVGLVPQEINLEPFERVINTVRFSRGLFGKPRNEALLERILRQLSLWDKRDNRIMELSGGMKRRVLIAKALAHEPRVLFLDEPTAGVDVELRRDMWDIVAELKTSGVTIILTTHYIEEAEAIADRIGVINKGEILLVEEKTALMTRLGQKELRIELQDAVKDLPEALAARGLRLEEGGQVLVYTYDTTKDRTGIATLIREVSDAGLVLRDLQTRQNSLEDIFVELVTDQEDVA